MWRAAPRRSWSPTGSSSFPVSRWVVWSFGPDGALYASAGDGASATTVDVGQNGNPDNDPINEGGALRSQDLESPADQVTLDGAIVRLDPNTGTPLPRTTSMVVGPSTVDATASRAMRSRPRIRDPSQQSFECSSPRPRRRASCTGSCMSCRSMWASPISTRSTATAWRSCGCSTHQTVSTSRSSHRVSRSNRGTAITRAPLTVDWKATS